MVKICLSSYLAVYQVVPPSVVMVSHFLTLSRKPIGTALGNSCLKSGTGKTGLVLILMIQINAYRGILLNAYAPRRGGGSSLRYISIVYYLQKGGEGGQDIIKTAYVINGRPHILVYTTILHFIHLLATYWHLSKFPDFSWLGSGI